MKQIEELKKSFIELYKNFKKIIPTTNRISLHICKYDSKDGMHINGFYHIGNECIRLYTIDDLIRMSILFRKFQ